MSYQVLARKWRPRLFREMVGQEHVLKALINALDHDRLHHAYLFTGTRGVGKTTIARILAKCLNCDIGVSSEPCNQCSSCTEINEGRFVDLIEVDAASRTKVEDTRELLDNVQYAPTRGRYKVYLIDEVHMLSNSSFNALLKTLEEPPPHVKFLLATTDPQKLPVTVLSRCLQFSLKNMSAERIVGHLQFVLEKEMVPFEEAGLWHLGRSADGSMRDALSLTDQAISFGNGKITEADVRSMLGSIDQTLVYDVLMGLINEDGAAILAGVNKLAEHSPDYSEVIGELIAVLHRIAIAQVIPEAIDNSLGDRKQIYDFAQKIASEDVQLYYQTALLGRRDLPLSPDARSGLEMVLLRMLAFKPQGVAELPKKALPEASLQKPQEQPLQESIAPATEQPSEIGSTSVATEVDVQVQKPVDSELLVAQADPQREPDKEHREAEEQVKKSEAVSEPREDQGSIREDVHVNADINSDVNNHVDSHLSGHINSPVDEAFAEYANTQVPPPSSDDVPPFEIDGTEQIAPEKSVKDQQKLVELADQSLKNLFDHKEPVANAFVNGGNEVSENKVGDIREGGNVAAVPVVSKQPLKKSVDGLAQFTPDNWFLVYKQLETGGLLQSTVANCIYVGLQGSTLAFLLDEQQSTLYDVSHQQRLADLLSDYFGQTVDVSMSNGQPTRETPAKIIVRLQHERQAQAEMAIQRDPVVMQLQENLGATIIEGSIEPIDS